MNDTPPRPAYRLKTRFRVTGIFAVILALYVAWDRAMDRFFKDLLVGDTGPVTSVDDWPRPLKVLADETSIISADHLQHYCLCQGFDPEYVWKMPCDDEAFSEIETRWQLTAIPTPNTHIFRGFSHNSGYATPHWCNPTELSNVSYYA